MRPAQLTQALQFAIAHRKPILVKGKPGIGKSDIMAQAAAAAGAHLLISHPVVSDPTDYKGLPANVEGEAIFLPFNELKTLIHATEPTVFFLDDLGQAPASVQAACMQLILARRINGHKVSDQVTFMAATNRKEDKAAVSGILEPVKSRFDSILELDVNADDWVDWALGANMPVELISFIRFKPTTFDDFVPTKDIVNGPSPRTVAAVGRWQNDGVPSALQFEIFKGAAGEAFAAEYTGFLKLFGQLPSIDEILLDPANAPVPTDAAAKYALTGAISTRLSGANVGNLLQYMDRLGGELTAATFKNLMAPSKLEQRRDVMRSGAFIEWANANQWMFGVN